MSGLAARGFPILLAGLLCGCGDTEPDGPPESSSFWVRDSAGVVIGQSAGSEGRPPGRWLLSDEPIVSVDVAADTLDPLSGIGDIVVLSDGRFVVAHRSRSELVWFDSTGTPLLAAGRDGAGPGEFRYISDLFRLPGDSVLVHDGGRARLSVFGPDGRFARTGRLELEASGGHSSRLVLAGERAILATRMDSYGPGSPQGMYRDTANLLRFALDGSFRGEIGPFPMEESRVFTMSGMVAVGFGIPFAKSTYFAPAENGFWIGTGDRPEVELRSPDGALLRIVRWADRPEPLTTRTIREWESELRDEASTPEERQEVRSLLAGLRHPETVPTLGGLMTDSDGNLWIQSHQGWFEPPVRRRSVFAPDGRPLGDVVLPDDFEPRAITADRIFGIWRDDLGVESVRVYRLRRTAERAR